MSSHWKGRVLGALVGLVALRLPAAVPTVEGRLYGAAVDEATRTGRLTGIAIEGSWDRELIETLRARLRGGVQLEVGNHQTSYMDDYSPRQVPKLREAVVEWRPLDWLTFGAGGLDQDRLESPTLLVNQTFPGVSERASFESDSFGVFFSAEQALPTGVSISETGAGRSGQVPTFFIERLGLVGRITPKLRTETSISHYAFANLSDSVAAQGRFFGNTVNGLGTTQADFAYSFRGYEAKGKVVWQTPWGPEATTLLAWYRNPAAPTNRNEAYRFRFEVAVDVAPNLKLVPSYQWFQVESDVGPAFYNGKDLGHSNRVGFSVGAEMQWAKERMAVGGQWVQARLLQANPYQADFRYVTFYLRGNYDFL